MKKQIPSNLAVILRKDGSITESTRSEVIGYDGLQQSIVGGSEWCVKVIIFPFREITESDKEFINKIAIDFLLDAVPRYKEKEFISM